MKRIIVSILILLPLFVFGQKMTFSSEILATTDPAVIAVRDLWKAYVTNCQSGFDKSSLDYWNKGETDQGFTDITKAAIGFPSYLFGDLAVSEIKKVDNGYYRIRNILSFGDSTNRFIFNVFAKKESNGYKLFNSFFINKPRLQHFQAENIEFYYPADYLFNTQKAKQSVANRSRISAFYGLNNKSRVIYIIGKNLDEANKFIGFEYTIYRSSQPAAAFTIKDQNIILTSREDNLHELIHTIFMPAFPNGFSLFQEGIATYYGGSAGQKYTDLVDQLGDMIKRNPDIDLSKISELDKVLKDGTNYFYTIGAILIEYALNRGGAKEVLAMFNYPFTDPNSQEEAISAIMKILGFEKGQINPFLKKYLQDHKVN